MRAILCGAMLLSWSAACTVDVSRTLPGAKLTCTGGPEECPEGMTCDLPSGYCRGAADHSRALGEPCVFGGECRSDRCGDGVCCDSECLERCKRCDLEGHRGSCTFVPQGQDPDGECEGDDPVCGTACDGAGGCTSTVGKPCGECQTCSPLGECAGACQPFACEAGTCQTTCSDDGQCAPGAHCDGSRCLGNKANGSLCAQDGECASGHCASGICCSEACAAQAPESCLTNGACNASGVGCTPFDAATRCADPRCEEGRLLSERLCDGAGACSAPTASDCSGHFGCADAKNCKRACQTTADCQSGYFCHPLEAGSGAECRKQKNGETCAQGAHCASTFCVHGICCDAPCSDQGAQSCGTFGTCVADSANPRFGQCALYPAGTACRGQSCKQGHFTAAQICAGDGSACPPGTPQICPGGAICADGERCVGQCAVNSHAGCPDGAWCRLVGGATPTCQKENQQPGEPCDVATDCAGGGSCNHGICCPGPGDCCVNRSGCPLDVDLCSDAPSCTNLSMRWSCTNFTCTSAPGGVDNCAGKLAAVCQNYIRDAYCPEKSCPTTCQVNGGDQDELCERGFYCLSGTCVALLDDKALCSRATQCRGGVCLNGHCCGASALCCASSADCPPRCSSPATCQGYKLLCQSSNCSTSAVDSSAPDDSGCLFDPRRPTASYACSATGLVVPCNGAVDQAPARHCSDPCSTFDNALRQCVANTAEDKASRPFCVAGAPCEATNASSCESRCRSCKNYGLLGLLGCWDDPQACRDGTTCTLIDQATCMATCQ